MNRTLAIATALGITLGTSGLALAQPAYGPNAVQYYPSYVAPPPPPVVEQVPPTVVYPPVYEDTHTGGGAGSGYWGPKSN